MSSLMAVAKLFSRERPLVDFFQKFFLGGTKMAKVCFSYSKLRKQRFFAKSFKILLSPMSSLVLSAEE